MNLTLSRITATEAESLRAVSIATFTETYAQFNTEENMALYIGNDLSLEQLTAELEAPENVFFLLMNGSTAVGFVKLTIADSPFQNSGIKGIELARIYVLKAFQGMKLGQYLLSSSIEFARAENCDYIWLGVWEHNENARGFYKKIGFSEIGEQYFQLGEDNQRDLVLSLKL